MLGSRVLDEVAGQMLPRAPRCVLQMSVRRRRLAACAHRETRVADGRYGETFRVTDASAHFRGPLAFRLPLACQLAVADGFTLATAATPSPTLLPAESVN